MIIGSDRDQHSAPSHWLWLALLTGVVSQFLLARYLGPLTGNARSQWVVALSLLIGLAIPSAFILFVSWTARASHLGQSAVVTIAIAGVLMRLPYFGAGPMLEDDHFRYMLDGAMTAHGLNPYTYAPLALLNGAAPEAQSMIAAAGRAAITQVNFPELRTIYPGTAQLLFALAHLITPWSVDGLRVVIGLSEVLTALLCLHFLRVLNRPRHLVALVWCNPLLAFSLTGQAHIDATMGPLLLVALLAVLRSRGLLAGAMLGAAIGVKLWPALLAPVLLRALGADRRAQIGLAVAMSAVATTMCLPLAIASLSPQSGLVAYASGWHINNLPYAWLSYAGYLLVGGDGMERYLRAAVAGACLVAAVVVAVRPISDPRDLVARSAFVAACVFYVSPAQFPWYAAWFLPLAALGPNWVLLAASAALPSYFLFFPLAETGMGDVFRFWLSGLHLLPVIMTALWLKAREPAA